MKYVNKIGICFLGLFVLTALELSSQVRTSDRSGMVVGRVTDADTNDPVPGVVVTARPNVPGEYGPPRSDDPSTSTTDADGRFTLREVPAGTAEVRISGRSPGISLAPTQTVSIGSGQAVTGIVFRVRFYASLSGHVYDDKLQALAGMRVGLVARSYATTGELAYSLVALSSAVTGRDGGYVVEGSDVTAGRKYWLIAFDPRIGTSLVNGKLPDPASSPPAFASAFYPNSDSLDGGLPVVLRSSEHRSGLDIHMPRTDSYCLSATLLVEGMPAELTFTLQEEKRSLVDQSGIPRGGPRSGADGKIQVCGLPPSRFHLKAFRYLAGASPTPGYFNNITIVIPVGNSQDIVVNAEKVMSVPGEVVFDRLSADQTQYPFQLNTDPIVRVTQPGGSVPPRFMADVFIPAQFSIDVLRSIPYGFRITGLQPNFYVKDILSDGESIIQQPFIASSNSRLRFVIARDGSRISIKAAELDGQAAKTAMVLILPAVTQSPREFARRMVSGLTDDTGTYLSPTMPPGTYRVLLSKEFPPSYIRQPQGLLVIDKSPETIEGLLSVRALGELVELGAATRIELALRPRALR